MLPALLSFSCGLTNALQVDTSCRAHPAINPVVSSLMPRRQFAQGAAALIGLGYANVAMADEEKFSKMAGLLEPYIDVQRGFKLYKPTGWNQANRSTC